MSKKINLKFRAYPENDFENRSRWVNVDNDSADVTNSMTNELAVDDRVISACDCAVTIRHYTLYKSLTRCFISPTVKTYL